MQGTHDTRTPLDYATPFTPDRRNWPAPLGVICGLIVIVAYCARPYWFRWFRVDRLDLVRFAIFAGLGVVGALVLGAAGVWIANRSSGHRWRCTAIVALCLGALNGPLLFALVEYQTQKAREDYGRSHAMIRCAGKLRELGQWVMIYAIEHEDRFPDSWEELVLSSSARGEHAGIAWALVCPLSDDAPAQGDTPEEVVQQLRSSGHVSYVYVGKGLTRATATPRHIIAYERPTNHGRRRESPLWILYGDGHVDRLSPADLRKLIEELGAGHNPPRAGMLK